MSYVTRSDIERAEKIHYLENMKKRLESITDRSEKEIEDWIAEIKEKYGLSLDDADFYQKLRFTKLAEQKRRFLEDAEKSFITDEQKRAGLSKLESDFNDQVAILLEERKKYVGKDDRELREICLKETEARKVIGDSLLRSATKGRYGSNDEDNDWALDKETRTLVGEIKYIEFMNKSQKDRKKSIRHQISNLSYLGYKKALTGGIAGLAAGFALAFGAGKLGMDIQTPLMIGGAAAGAFLNSAISLARRSKAVKLLKKMIANKNKEVTVDEIDPKYSAYVNAKEQAQASHEVGEDYPDNSPIYLEQLGLVNAAVDNAQAKAGRSM